MKTLKLLSILCFIILASCNNDDDASGSEQTYFPTQISTVQTGASDAVNMNIQYDANNRISQFNFVNGAQTNTYDTTYNSDGIITSIMHTRPDASTLEYAFEYSNGKVSQVTLNNASSSVPLNVDYDEFANTYTVPSASSDLVFKYDASGNVIDINAGVGNILFNYNSNEGVFKNSDDNFPYILVISLGASTSNIFNSLIFSTKQLTGMSLFGINVNIESTRDEQNQIETVKLIDATSFDIQSTSTITYELRTIN